MTEVFIIQNHDQTYLGKQGDWTSGCEASQLFRTHHKDEAINMKVEQSVRNPQLRLSIVTGELNDKGQLQLNHPSTRPSIDSEAEVLFNNEQTLPTNSEPTLTTQESNTSL